MKSSAIKDVIITQFLERRRETRYYGRSSYSMCATNNNIGSDTLCVFKDDKSVADQDEAMSPADMDEELLEVESTAQSCIMHALRIVCIIHIIHVLVAFDF